MIPYQIYILPDERTHYSRNIITLLKKHECSSVVITLGNTPPFLQEKVPNAFFIKNRLCNHNTIMEEITRRNPLLILMEHFFSDDLDRAYYDIEIIQKGIDRLLTRVLRYSIDKPDIAVVFTVPACIVNSTVQRFGMAEKIFCFRSFQQEKGYKLQIADLEKFNYKVNLYDEIIQLVPMNKTAETEPQKTFFTEPPVFNDIYRQEFSLYQHIRKIKSRIELFLFIQHLREIYRFHRQEYLFYVINQTSIFLDSYQDPTVSIAETDMNEYIYKISAYIPHLTPLLDAIIAFFALV